jgi:UDP:flavonoid glycosyltransferase YjiC (YdhE family)
MRILLTAEGTRGDVYPLLALGEACLAEGHDVTVCAPANFEGTARSRGFAFRSTGTDVVAYLEEHAAAVIRGGRRLARAQRHYLEVLLDRAFDALCEAASGADLLLAAGVQISAPSAADLHRIPFRYVTYCPALLPSPEHTPAILPTQALPRWANRLAWRWLAPLLLRPALAGINRRRRELELSPARDALGHMLGRNPVLLAADEELAPAPLDCGFTVERIGALQTDAEGPLPGKLEAFLEAGPAPVYIGFGSMTDPAPAATTRIVLDAVERAGCRALLSSGWAGLGEGALPEQVFPLGSVCHARLFPRVATVVHHGGAGTTTTAARAGVPQILIPHLMDQFYWARRVEHLGLGPPALPRKTLGQRRLAETLAATLDNEWLAERAGELGRRLRDRDPLRPENRKTLVDKVLAI